jgi:hypothetical protein
MGTHSQAISDVLVRLKCLFFQRLRVRMDCAWAHRHRARELLVAQISARKALHTTHCCYSTTSQVAVFLAL